MLAKLLIWILRIKTPSKDYKYTKREARKFKKNIEKMKSN